MLTDAQKRKERLERLDDADPLELRMAYCEMHEVIPAIKGWVVAHRLQFLLEHAPQLFNRAL